MNAAHAAAEQVPVVGSAPSRPRALRRVTAALPARDEPDPLAGALRRRDPRAIEMAYARHAPAVLGFLQRAVGDRGAAEDVLQEVFVDAWRRAEDYDPARANLVNWLLMIARSRAIDHLRRRVPEPRDPTDPLGVAAHEDPEDAVDALLGQWRFAALMERLSEEEAHILRLRFHVGLSQSEISDRTGLPLGTVKTRMNRALARLRDLFDDEGWM